MSELVAITTESRIRTAYRCERPNAYLGAPMLWVDLQRDLNFGLQGAAGAAFLSLPTLGPGSWVSGREEMTELEVRKWDTDLLPGAVGQRKAFVKPVSLY